VGIGERSVKNSNSDHTLTKRGRASSGGVRGGDIPLEKVWKRNKKGGTKRHTRLKGKDFMHPGSSTNGKRGKEGK